MGSRPFPEGLIAQHVPQRRFYVRQGLALVVRHVMLSTPLTLPEPTPVTPKVRTGVKPMRHKLVASVALALVFCVNDRAKADWLEVNPAGLPAIQKFERDNGLSLLVQHRDPKFGGGHFIRGRVLRVNPDPRYDDGSDRANLQEPAKYFWFRPMDGNYVPKPKPHWVPSNIFRFDWRWVRSIRHEIDTLDDVRSIVSNRD